MRRVLKKSVDPTALRYYKLCSPMGLLEKDQSQPSKYAERVCMEYEASQRKQGMSLKGRSDYFSGGKDVAS